MHLSVRETETQSYKYVHNYLLALKHLEHKDLDRGLANVFFFFKILYIYF